MPRFSATSSGDLKCPPVILVQQLFVFHPQRRILTPYLELHDPDDLIVISPDATAIGILPEQIPVKA
jgi:hypothetical protein